MVSYNKRKGGWYLSVVCWQSEDEAMAQAIAASLDSDGQGQHTQKR